MSPLRASIRRRVRPTRTALAVVTIAMALIAAGCGDDEDDDPTPAATSQQETTPAEPDSSSGTDNMSSDDPEESSNEPDEAPEPAETEMSNEPDEPEDSSDSGSDAAAVEPVNSEPLRVGSLLDETGPLNIYGTPMADATRLAIASINANGGVLGRQLELVALDSKSDQNEYIAGADQLAAEDLAVVHAGITSASREAIRPIFGEAELLYF